MKLTQSNLAIFKNFASLNCNLFIPANSTEVTTYNAPKKTVLCRAELQDGMKFPVDFGIYDLNNFLGAATLFEDPEIEFGDKDQPYCVIRDGANKKRKLKYYFAAKKTLQIPTVSKIDIEDEDVIAEFDLTADNLKSILKSAALMQLDSICVGIDESAASIGAKNTENETKQSNTYSIDISDVVQRGPAFDGTLVEAGLDKLLVNPLPIDYSVKITKKVIVFTSKPGNPDITYWYALKRSV